MAQRGSYRKLRERRDCLCSNWRKIDSGLQTESPAKLKVNLGNFQSWSNWHCWSTSKLEGSSCELLASLSKRKLVQSCRYLKSFYLLTMFAGCFEPIWRNFQNFCSIIRLPRWAANKKCCNYLRTWRCRHSTITITPSTQCWPTEQECCIWLQCRSSKSQRDWTERLFSRFSVFTSSQWWTRNFCFRSSPHCKASQTCQECHEVEFFQTAIFSSSRKL